MIEHRCISGQEFRKRFASEGGLFVAGAAIGAALMYFLDPNRGRLRRTQVTQRAASTVRRTGEELTGRAEDWMNRARGAAARASGFFEPREQGVPDDVLAARVRSRLGHLTDHAGSIVSGVHDGVVTVQGPLGPDKRRILAGIWNTDGVQDVEILPPAGTPA